MYTIHLGQTLFAASSSTQLPDVVLQGISGGQDSSVKTQFRNDKMLQECKRRMNMRNAKAEFGLDWYSISGGPANDKVPGQVNMHGVLSAAAVVVWGASSGILRAIMLEQLLGCAVHAFSVCRTKPVEVREKNNQNLATPQFQNSTPPFQLFMNYALGYTTRYPLRVLDNSALSREYIDLVFFIIN